MKPKILILLLLVATLPFLTSLKFSDYEITAYFKAIETPRDAFSLNTDDELSETKLLLVKQQLPEGKYVVKVTKVAKDLYRIDGKKIDGKEIYIQTKYCYEYAYGKEVILKVDGNYGFSKGRLIF
ncbi:hypothetical protein [Mucilaginibacter celer]|uniref:Uncharacterized protein n=1 Tax=Mucilaginibacter celer TaxID=2305508 RepID=A0A494VI57_9SPHI|nr:hypothetical protein [Mucilaginibacter celer]AYL93774.1 hypothetical protein HYN43_000010 [Mucilaginibacter celer]